MLKKYVLKMSNSLGTVNYMRPAKSSYSRSPSDAGSDESDYNLMEVNRDLFIENYLIGRDGSKIRSSSLNSADNASKELAIRRNNHRRKSFMEKRDDRLKINRNHLFDRDDRTDRAVARHRISVDIYDDFEELNDERNLGCDFIETSAPTLKKINNNLREFVDAELSIRVPAAICILMEISRHR